MQVQLRRLLLGEAQPVLIVLERPVRVDARLDAELGRAELDRVGDPLREVLLGVLVGVGRALALPEAAERAADDADVGDVDVAVDDERDRLPRELGAQAVGGGAHLLDHLGTLLGEQRRQLLGASARSPRAPFSIARPATSGPTVTSPRRPEPRRGMNDQ